MIRPMRLAAPRVAGGGVAVVAVVVAVVVASGGLAGSSRPARTPARTRAVTARSPAPAPLGAGSALTAAARRATRYLLAAQNADGGYGPAPGQPSDGLFSGWTALGLASAGVRAADVRHGGASLLDAIERHPGRDTGSLERTILALASAGVSVRARAQRRLVTALIGRRRPDGSFGEQVNLTTFAVLALRAARLAPAAATLRWLVDQQDGDGGFGFGPRGGTSDPDDTGAVLEALSGEPHAAAVRARAVSYLRRTQDGDGGFESAAGSGSNAQSTAWAVQGLIAAGIDPGGVRARGGASPLGYLVSLTAPDGRVGYARGLVQTPVWVTAEALMALEGRPLPIGR
jgi:prenyltransferase beta subunit